MTSKFCHQCGTESKPGAKFCHACGLPVEATQEPSVAVPAPTPPAHVKPPAQPDTGLHPWRRFFARTIDLLCVAGPLALLPFWALATLFPAEAARLVGNEHGATLILGMVAYWFWVPIEAALISTIGTTPGKWIFGIRVLNASGQKLSYGNAIKRAALVCSIGDGFGIYPISGFTRAYAYDKLKKIGTTKWDVAVGSIVQHSTWGVGRIIAATAVVLVALVSSSIFIGVSKTYDAKVATSTAQSQSKTPPQSNEKRSDNTPSVDNDKKQKLIVAANQGDATARAELGVIYSIEGNDDEAVRLFRLAADQGNLLGLHRLGTSHHWGDGVPQDYKESARLFRLAADKGDASAQYMLAMSYREGLGVPQDHKEYMRYLGKAADQGHSTAFHQLGNEYSVFSLGRLTPEESKRNVLAYALYNHSCSIRPDSGSCMRRDQIKTELTTKELEVGQLLTREFEGGTATQVITRYLKSGPVKRAIR